MKHSANIILFGGAVLAVLGLSDVGSAGADRAERSAAIEVNRRLFVMGTVLDVAVASDNRETAVRASQAAVEEVENADLRLSTWRDDSELAGFNSTSVGRWLQISDELRKDLSDAVHWSDATGRAFDPGIGSLVRAWRLRDGGRVPEESELDELREGSSSAFLSLKGMLARRLDANMVVEEGGFGKGAALRDAGAAALSTGADCVILDFGGQIEIRGACEAREIVVAHPGDRSPVAVLRVTEGSIATSGNSERAGEIEGSRLGHILDPRTGRPAPDWGSVTVLANDALTADCLATALFVMGPDEGRRWLEGFPQIQAVFAKKMVGGGVRLSATSGLRTGFRSGPGHGSIDWIPSGKVLPEPREHSPPRVTES
jgi:thiamine biosynthesis lipoprotein